VITSQVEHSATQGACNLLRAEEMEIVEIAVNQEGLLDMEQLERELGDDVAVASLMWANNETGVIFDIAKAAALCKAHRVPFHCDATQAIGKVPVNVKEAGVDAMSFAAHKFHGPKGVGGLYLRRGLRVATLVAGGPQEMTRRGGTENAPGIVGMGVAAELAQEHLAEMKQVAKLRDRLEEGILSAVTDAQVNGSRECRVPNTTNIGFPRLESEAILLLLSEKGICASAGAACSSGSLEPSHVLRAMKVDAKVAHGAIRFSLSRYTTEEEVETAIGMIPPLIEKLRAVLPV
jgi:cysteine desulfurase